MMSKKKNHSKVAVKMLCHSCKVYAHYLCKIDWMSCKIDWMSCKIDLSESWHTYECVISLIGVTWLTRKSHVTRTKRVMPHISKVVSHMWIRHESCLTHREAHHTMNIDWNESWHTYECVISLIGVTWLTRKSHVTHTKRVVWHISSVVSHTWIRHESCLTNEEIYHTWTSHVPHMNETCHTRTHHSNALVMTHICMRDANHRRDMTHS